MSATGTLAGSGTAAPEAKTVIFSFEAVVGEGTSMSHSPLAKEALALL
jgi:hypothetical protein